MRSPYQAPTLHAAGDVTTVTNGWKGGWGRDYYYRRWHRGRRRRPRRGWDGGGWDGG